MHGFGANLTVDCVPSREELQGRDKAKGPRF